MNRDDKLSFIACLLAVNFIFNGFLQIKTLGNTDRIDNNLSSLYSFLNRKDQDDSEEEIYEKDEPETEIIEEEKYGLFMLMWLRYLIKKERKYLI